VAHCPGLPSVGLASRGRRLVLAPRRLAVLCANRPRVRGLRRCLTRLGRLGALRRLLGPVIAGLLLGVGALLALPVQLAPNQAGAHVVTVLSLRLAGPRRYTGTPTRR